MIKYDLEERTLRFALNVRQFVAKVPRTIASIEDCKQLVRSSGSVAANYIEANEGLSPRDFLLRIKICKKEAKESILWLRLLAENLSASFVPKANELIKEATELMYILATIIQKQKAKEIRL